MLRHPFPLIAWAGAFLALPTSGYAQTSFDDDQQPPIGGGATGTASTGSARTLFDIRLVVEAIRQREPEQGGGAAADELGERTSLVFGGNYETNDRPDTALQEGFTVDIAGAMLGVDHRFTDNWVLGGFADYQNEDTDFSDVFDEFQDMDEIGGALYSYYSVGDNGFLTLLVRYGDQDYDIQRVTSAG